MVSRQASRAARGTNAPCDRSRSILGAKASARAPSRACCRHAVAPMDEPTSSIRPRYGHRRNWTDQRHKARQAKCQPHEAQRSPHAIVAHLGPGMRGRPIARLRALRRLPGRTSDRILQNDRIAVASAPAGRRHGNSTPIQPATRPNRMLEKDQSR
eukprot:scaffold27982_cov31-Tisochrysis_lutea.AAC.9